METDCAKNPANRSHALDESSAAIMWGIVLRKAYRIAAQKKTGYKQMKRVLTLLGLSTDESAKSRLI